MIVKKHLISLGMITAVAIALISATAAVAEATPRWPLSSTEEVTAALPVEVAGKAEKAGTLSIANQTFSVSCEKLAPETAHLEEKGTGSGRLVFGSCKTLIKGVVSKPCEPFNGTEKGVAKSEALKAQLVSHEGATLVRLEAKTGETLVKIHLGEECAVGEEIIVKGAFDAKESNGELEVLKESHLFEEGPLSALKVGANAATVSGSASLSLAGAHAGRWWSGSGSKSSWSLSTANEVTAALPVEVAGKAEKAGTLSIANQTFSVSCEKLAPETAHLEEKGTGSGRLVFGSCKTLIKGVVSKPCEPFNGTEKGVAKSEALKAQLVSHEGATLVRLEAKTGETLVKIHLGEECAVGEEIIVKGAFDAKESNGELEVLKESHLFEEGPLSALKVGANAATVSGSASLSLAGAHAGRWWSGSA